ncbi:MAG: acetyl-CoA carboxylase biotin carboxyl carrier protein [Bacteroidota bacterium]
MDLSYIKKIIKLVEHSSIDELELEEEGTKIKVARNRNSGVYVQTTPLPALPSHNSQHVELTKPATSNTLPKSQYHEVRSPIVGTFYRAPAPDVEPYIEIGQSVKIGSVLCIVEAMKLMNEIESDCDGTVVKIIAENGKPVEYNQILFLIEKA